MAKSRITRNLERQSRKQLIIFTIATGFIVYLLLQYGLSLLGEFGSLISSIKEAASGSSQNKNNPRTFTEPPLLSIPYSATNSATIIIAGKTNNTRESVEIYVNNEIQQEIKLLDSQSFTSAPLELKEGENTIKARSKTNDGSISEFTDEFIIYSIKKEPKLDVTYPSDNLTFLKEDQEITVKGNTEPVNKVTVNGFLAIVDHEGNFSYPLRLNGGENNIAVEVKDPAGNVIKKEIKVSYNP